MTQRTSIYARYSSDLQSDASIEDQIRLCSERADAEGWKVANWVWLNNNVLSVATHAILLNFFPELAPAAWRLNQRP